MSIFKVIFPKTPLALFQRNALKMCFSTRTQIRKLNTSQQHFQQESANPHSNSRGYTGNQLMEYQIPPCDLYKLTDGPSLTTKISRAEIMQIYDDMLTIRTMEERCATLYMEKIIRGFCHLCSGQEACCVGVKSGINRNDSLITAYRVHGWSYTRGISVREIIAELCGKATGCSKGVGGSMHMYAQNFYGGNGIVGAQIPVGAGIAFTHKYKNDGRICVSLYGDGAANQGQIFEAMNMAALWKLPCLFICENNHYGMGTSDVRSSANTEYYTRGDAIPGIRVDGMSILSIREATKWCANYIRSGNGPLLMELDAYRYRGHSMSDPGVSYRTRKEVQAIRNDRDPIKLFVAFMQEHNLIDDEEIIGIEANVKARVQDAVNYSMSSSVPDLAQVYSNVYSTPYSVRGPENDQLSLVQ